MRAVLAVHEAGHGLIYALLFKQPPLEIRINMATFSGGYNSFNALKVKTRSNLACGLPREYVTAAKQERIRKTAAFYLMEKGLDCPVRFDVAEVYTDGAHSPAATHIEYIENAF